MITCCNQRPKSFATALFVGGLTSVVYALTTSVCSLVVARCFWGASWSIIRLAGLLVVTDCVDAGLSTEATVGQMTGISAGLSRMGTAVGMALGGFACDLLGFDVLFIAAGLLTVAAVPYAYAQAFGTLPHMSVTAVGRLQHRTNLTPASNLCNRLQLNAVQYRLFALAFAASCAGNGMILSTLGAVLSARSLVDSATGRQQLDLSIACVDTASFNGVLLGVRWALEGFGAPFYGRLVDGLGWRTVAPAHSLSTCKSRCRGRNGRR